MYQFEDLRYSSIDCWKANRGGFHTVQPKLQMSALGLSGEPNTSSGAR